MSTDLRSIPLSVVPKSTLENYKMCFSCRHYSDTLERCHVMCSLLDGSDSPLPARLVLAGPCGADAIYHEERERNVQHQRI